MSIIISIYRTIYPIPNFIDFCCRWCEFDVQILPTQLCWCDGGKHILMGNLFFFISHLYYDEEE